MDFDFTAQLEKQLDDIANGKQQWIPTLQEFYGPFNEALVKATIEMPRIRVEEPTNDICEKCGRPMVIKSGRFGPFMTCSGFPDCRNSRPIIQKTGANCPKCKDGDLLQRRGKGRIFFGCSTYPQCDFTVSARPIPIVCPECEGLLVVAASNSARCTNCAFRGSLSEFEVENEKVTESNS
jgi:DNA topoisomerase-1